MNTAGGAVKAFGVKIALKIQSHKNVSEKMFDSLCKVQYNFHLFFHSASID